MDYLVWKWLHILSSTLLFGTGIGTAFFMFCTNRGGDPRAIAAVTRIVVIADWIFTATTVVFQPLSGVMLMRIANIGFDAFWIRAAFVLYAVAGACWLPVVWLQLRMRRIAGEAADEGALVLPPRYWQLERAWILLGIPAFTALVITFYLMVAKPV